MPDFDINIEFEVFCSCGNGLCGQATGSTNYRGGPVVTVEPCEKCLEDKYDKGYTEGYEDGQNP